MGLPRGRRWVDLPRTPAVDASARWAEMKQVLLEPDRCMSANDLIAEREQMHRDAEASIRRQGELPLTATR